MSHLAKPTQEKEFFSLHSYLVFPSSSPFEHGTGATCSRWPFQGFGHNNLQPQPLCNSVTALWPLIHSSTIITRDTSTIFTDFISLPETWGWRQPWGRMLHSKPKLTLLSKVTTLEDRSNCPADLLRQGSCSPTLHKQYCDSVIRNRGYTKEQTSQPGSSQHHLFGLCYFEARSMFHHTILFWEIFNTCWILALSSFC